MEGVNNAAKTENNNQRKHSGTIAFVILHSAIIAVAVIATSGENAAMTADAAAVVVT